VVLPVRLRRNKSREAKILEERLYEVVRLFAQRTRATRRPKRAQAKKAQAATLLGMPQGFRGGA
jgi:hypothetical protein